MPNFDEVSLTKTGASFKIRGKLVTSPAKGQAFELQVCSPEHHSAHVYGNCDAATYPLSGRGQTVEFLREKAHLRPRTRLVAAITRVRNNLSYATHKFFQERGFQYIHTPIITASDCEGAGEMFQVTTTLPAPEKPLVPNTPMLSYKGQMEEETRIAAEKEARAKGGKKP